MLNLISYQEMQITLTVKYHVILIRIVIMKKMIITSGEDVEKVEPL